MEEPAPDTPGCLERVVPEVSRIMVRLQRAAMRSSVDLLENVQGPVSTARGTVLALHAASGVRESHTTTVKEGIAAYITLNIRRYSAYGDE